jgi:hypothetical protein
MRQLTEHNVGAVNEKIRITVADEPGSGGANHLYAIDVEGLPTLELVFQKGALLEVGPNGITQEALLAVVIDRLRCFQEGPFPSEENKNALDNAEAALEWLQLRTRNRIERGVEGKEVA